MDNDGIVEAGENRRTTKAAVSWHLLPLAALALSLPGGFCVTRHSQRRDPFKHSVDHRRGPLAVWHSAMSPADRFAAACARDSAELSSLRR